METQIKVNTLDITPVDMRQIHDSLNVIEMDIEQRKQQSTWPVLVCGLGRCGSSLTMQMLHAGGFPTFGAWPAFEPQQVAVGRNVNTPSAKADGFSGNA